MSTDHFLLALQAYQEIQSELQQEKHSLPITADMPASDPVAPLLDGSLLFGLAEDGLPVMFDLYDPAPGPLLVTGDGGCGKTAFLQSLARLSDVQNPGDVYFGVLTAFPDEWETLEAQSNCLGVWPSDHPSTLEFLSRMVNWAEALAESRQIVLLLVDGLEMLAGSDYQVQHHLRWLLMRGPESHIWPIVSTNSGQFSRLKTWPNYFQTCILGHAKYPHGIRNLTGEPALPLADLQPGLQFVLSRPNGWLRFWLPPLTLFE